MQQSAPMSVGASASLGPRLISAPAAYQAMSFPSNLPQPYYVHPAIPQYSAATMVDDSKRGKKRSAFEAGVGVNVAVADAQPFGSSMDGQITQDIRRQKHKEVEIRRRKKLSELFNKLSQALDCGPTDKASILMAALNELNKRKATNIVSAGEETKQSGSSVSEVLEAASDAAETKKETASVEDDGDDVRPKKKLQRPITFDYALLTDDQATAPLSFLDLSRNCIISNRAFYTWFGLTDPSTFPSVLSQLVNADDCKDFFKLVEQVRSGHIQSFDFNLRLNPHSAALVAAANSGVPLNLAMMNANDLQIRVHAARLCVDGAVRYVSLTWSRA